MQDLLKVAAQAQRLATITAPARAARTSGRKRSMQVGQPRASAPRPRARRTAASSSTSSADPGDDGSEPPPPRPRLWRHPRFGLCSPALLRLLVREQAEEAQR